MLRYRMSLRAKKRKFNSDELSSSSSDDDLRSSDSTIYLNEDEWPDEECDNSIQDDNDSPDESNLPLSNRKENFIKN